MLLEDGTAHRGTFIIDPNGVLLHMSVTAHDVGRSVDEVLRVLRAFRTGALCPADWAPGDATLTSRGRLARQGVPRPRRARSSTSLGDAASGCPSRPATRSSPRASSRTASTSSRGGEVSISRRGPDGDEVKLATLGQGQFFGEVGILAETRRTATVRAVDDVELFGLSWQIFQETLERSDRADRDFAEIAKDRIAVTS